MKIIISLPDNIGVLNEQSMLSKVSAVANDHSQNWLNGREVPVTLVEDVIDVDNAVLAQYIFSALDNTDVDDRTPALITEILNDFEKGAR